MKCFEKIQTGAAGFRTSAMLLPFLMLGFLLLVPSAPAAALAPRISITYPTENQTFDTNSSIITCSGTVADGGDGYVQLYLNSVFVQNVPITSSVFSTTLVLVSGDNKIQISDTNADGIDTATVNVKSTRIRNDIRVNMVWDDGATDVDLHLFCPAYGSIAAERIWWTDKTHATGGNLDVDNVIGYGPENISFPAGTAPTGNYTGAVNLYSRSGASRDINVRITIFLNEGTAGQTTTVLDTITVTLPNNGADVATGELPTNVNSNSTKFFTFYFSPYGAPSLVPEEIISYPNPFIPTAAGNVTFKAVHGTGIHSIIIMSFDGRVLRTFQCDDQSSITWDGRNTQGALLASGTYIVVTRLSTGKTLTTKMTMLH